MNLVQNELGYELKTPDFTIFFGGKKSQLPELKKHYPDFEFIRVKQIHSDAVVASNELNQDLLIHADAHYTQKNQLALCVITADCVPAFIYHPLSGFIAGIHAGWRGVANKIIPKTIQRLKLQGVDPQEMQIFIGPHIQKQSFEVEGEVRDQILHSVGPEAFSESAGFFEKKSDAKYLVDLNAVVKAQLVAEDVSLENVFGLHIDTYANTDFHSYRRDKEKSGRQISFIAKNTASVRP